MKIRLKHILSIFLLLLVPLFSTAQEAQKNTKKELAKKRRIEERKQAKAKKEAAKFHMQIQTKEVRKRMKKSRKEAYRNNERKPGLFRRIFH